MITNEMLSADAALNGLTDEQKNAIITMSKNDEDVVIGKRFSEVYNQLDATIAKETGIARNGDEKTYNYLERAARALATKANSVDGLNSKIAELTKEREKLQKALEEGGDDAVKKQLAQATKDLEAVKKQYDTLKEENGKLKADYSKELLNVQIDNVLNNAKIGLTFKKDFEQEAINTLLAQAINTIKAMSPEFKEKDGVKRLEFKNENGETLLNPEKHFEPYTAEELLKKELTKYGILEGRTQQGTGTKTPTGGGATPTMDLSMARTQVEASEIIHNQLMAQGLVKGSKQYQDAMTQAWKDGNVSSLPMQ